MEVTLNPGKRQFYSIGKKFFLNFAHPGPATVSPADLTNVELGQLIYGIKNKILSCDGVDELNNVINELKDKRTGPPEKKEIQVKTAKVPEPVNLEKILAGKSFGTIKKNIIELEPSNLSKILKLEKDNKNRPGVIKLTSELLDKHYKEVVAKVGNEELEFQANNSELLKGLGAVELNNISDIIEDEAETVTIELPSRTD